MKYIAVLCALVSVAYAVPALINTGASAQFRSQDNVGNYAFGYNEDHATGGTFRRESGSHGIKVGSYGLRDIDGRMRVVNYVADGLGFRANIQTNEPGVEPKDPAATLINKAGIVAAAPVVAHAGYAAPIAHAAYAAPIVAAAPIAKVGYSVATSHVAGPVGYAGYGGAIAAPLGYAGYGLGGLGYKY